ncbi:MAG: hybrid sensor histidine kinase/response regulator [Candidatus Zhuqueibacterota bacterium]
MNENILIVEDNEFVQKNLVRLLKLEHYHVAVADNGEIALRVMQHFTPDLILSDIMMPVMDGYELFEHLQQNFDLKNTPFIFLTSKSDQQDIRLAKRLGADDYIIKPYDSEDVLITIRARLDKFRSIRENFQKEVEELKQEILFKLSHEIRTPIAVVKGVSELISSSKNMSIDDLHQMAQILSHGSNRLEKLINKFLTVKSLAEILQEPGKRQLYQSQQFEISSGLESSLRDSFEAALQEYSIDLKISWEDRHQSLYPIFHNHLKSILSELLENAIKFSANGGLVELSILNSSGGLTIDITDQGIGVPESEIPKLYTKFYQYNRQKMEQQGAGLGLTIVQSIVNLYNGQIEFRSEVGVGTRVRIVIKSPAAS